MCITVQCRTDPKLECPSGCYYCMNEPYASTLDEYYYWEEQGLLDKTPDSELVQYNLFGIYGI